MVIIHDDGKKTVVGIFDELRTAAVPAVRQMGFYARLTDMEGAYKFTVRIVLLSETGETFVGAVETGDAIISDRLGILDLALNLPPVPFPEFGRYEFQLFMGDVYLGRSTIKVVKMNLGGSL